MQLLHFKSNIHMIKYTYKIDKWKYLLPHDNYNI